MPHSEPVAILLVNEIAEEIKLATLSFRRFFPNCRVEAVYSLDEAIQWAQQTSWHLILLDEGLLAQRPAPIYPELKRLTPAAVLVLQTERTDTAAALSALQAGADFLLYKKSPAFLTELVLYARDALEKRDLRLTLERTQERYSQLIDAFDDVVYELDAQGRFTYVSPPVTRILGYMQEELIGAPYSILVPPDQLSHARRCFDDRRTGTRASRRIELDLIRKAGDESPAPVRVRTEISAKGLYDSQRRYRGTVGLLRDVSQHRRQEEAIHHLEHQLRETERLLSLAQQLSTLAGNLHAPHTAIQSRSQLLLKALRETQLIEHLESLASSAAEAARLGAELTHAAAEIGTRQNTLNDIIDAVLAATQPPLLNTGRIERSLAANLPPFTGNSDAAMQFFRTLIGYAQRHLATTGSRHRLRISTRPVVPDDTPITLDSTARAPAIPVEIQVHLEETDAVAAEGGPQPQATGDLFEAYDLVKQLGGRVDFLAPAGGLLSIRVWIPTRSTPPPDSGLAPSPPPVSFPRAPVEPSSVAAPQSAKPAPQPPAISSPTPPARLNRRKNVRTATSLPARVTIGNALREGIMTDLSPNGAALEIEGRFPPLEQQPASLTLKTAAGTLELQATAHDQGIPTRLTAGAPPTSRVGFRFASLTDTERKILESYVEEARARTLAATVEALFLTMDTPDESAEPIAETTLRGTDHRETLRVRVALPVWIDLPLLKPSADRPLGLAVNFSRGGLCLQTRGPIGSVGDLIALHFSSTGHLGQPRAHEPEAPEAILAGRIVHIAPDHTVPSELRDSPTPSGQRIGIRFVQLDPFAEREINRVIAQHAGSSVDLAGIAGRSSIVSARRECRNSRRQVIAVTDDHARHQISPGTPIVVIAPGFGLTQTDYLSLSFYLAANRFRVLRYDHTNHVGQSEGDILESTLRGMETDLQAVFEFVRTTWPAAPLTLLAEDVAARVALKVMARNKAADQLFLLNPVLDIGAALSALFHPSIIDNYRQGVRRGVANLWGLNVNLDQFIGDAVAGGYTDMASATEDLAGLVAQPVILTSPRRHHPIHRQFGPQDQAFRALGTSPIVVPLHMDVSCESSAYDERHNIAFRTIVKLMSRPTPGNHPFMQASEPAGLDIHHQRQLEQERIRIRHHVSQATRDALWVARLSQLSGVSDLADFRALENDVYRRLLPLDPDMTVIDIGCGQSDFAQTMFTNQIYQLAHRNESPASPLRYVGVDQSLESLKLAEQHIGAFLRELGTATGSLSAAQSVSTNWLRSAWDSPLPFADRSADRILCHLSLSFAPSPLSCLRQALRVLRQDGKMVITCVQPHTDLSPLFRRHLRAAQCDPFSPSAQIVMHFFARLREAIRHGVLHSYERNDLARLLIHAGAGPTQIVSAVDGQLLLAVVEKAKSAG